MKHISPGFALSVVVAAVTGCGGAGAQGGFIVESTEPPPPPMMEAPPPGPPTSEGVESSSSSWTLAEQEHWTKLQEEMDWFAKRANEHCGSAQITATYVKESFRGQLTHFLFLNVATVSFLYGTDAVDAACGQNRRALKHRDVVGQQSPSSGEVPHR